MKRLLSLAAAAALTACAPSTDDAAAEATLTSVTCSIYNIRMSSALPAGAPEALMDAVVTWQNKVTGETFKTEFGNAPPSEEFLPCVISVVPYVSEHVGDTASRQNLATGRVISAVVYVTVSEEDDELRHAAMLHEWGHVLGLSHEDDARVDSVMRRVMYAPPRIGCVDAQRACVIWGCVATCQGGWL